MIMHARLAAQHTRDPGARPLQSAAGRLCRRARSGSSSPTMSVLQRQAHSTLEVFNKYAMILAGAARSRHGKPAVGGAHRLSGGPATDTAARPAPVVFFFGLPCIEQESSRDTRQCQDLLRRHRTSHLRRDDRGRRPVRRLQHLQRQPAAQLCDPATTAPAFHHLLGRRVSHATGGAVPEATTLTWASWTIS